MRKLTNSLKSNLLIFILLLICTVSCKKDKLDESDDPQTEKPDIEVKRAPVTGSIALPEGSNININTLTAISPIDEVKLSSSQYSLKVAADFSTELITNTAGEIMLMGYSYPDEKDNIIDVNSTALAMVMNMPFCMSLNEEGKKQVISKAKSSGKFTDLVNQITNSINKGKAATDETNATLIQALADLIIDIESTIKNPGKTGNKPISVGKTMEIRSNTSAIVYPPGNYFRPVPLKVNTAASVISFENNRLACAFAVGIYVDGKNEKSFVIPGIPMFASSITDLFAGYFGDGYTEPFQELVNLHPNKEYEISIRSGHPGLYDSSPEYKTAMYANAKQIVTVLFSNFLPDISDFKVNCFQNYKMRVIQLTYETLELLKDANQSNAGSTAVEIAGKALAMAVSTAEDCRVRVSFFKTIKKFFDFSSKVTLIAETSNTTVQIFDWLNSRPAIDTCFTLINNKIVTCKPDPFKIEIVSGNEQIAEDGQKLANPLKVKVTDLAGKVIEGINVVWTIKTGGGSLNNKESLTGANGHAEIEWTPGLTGEQIAEASVVKKDGTSISVFFISFSDLLQRLIGKWSISKEVETDYINGVKEPEEDIESGGEIEFRADKTALWTNVYGEVDTYTYSTGGNLLTFLPSRDPGKFQVKKITLTELELYAESERWQENGATHHETYQLFLTKINQ